MGIVIVYGFLPGLLVTVVLGLAAIGVFLLGRKRGRGSWATYLGLSLLVAGFCAGAGFVIFAMSESGSAPVGDPLINGLIAFACMGAAPGLGLTAGLLSLVSKRKNQPSKERANEPSHPN